jgi:hypothetical protein
VDTIGSTDPTASFPLDTIPNARRKSVTVSVDTSYNNDGQYTVRYKETHEEEVEYVKRSHSRLPRVGKATQTAQSHNFKENRTSKTFINYYGDNGCITNNIKVSTSVSFPAIQVKQMGRNVPKKAQSSSNLFKGSIREPK